jgi:AraC-like DNA-binding protein
MNARTFLYRTFPVSPALRPYVHCFGVFEAVPAGAAIRPVPGEKCHQTFPADDRLTDSVIPDGRVMLNFNLGDAFTLEHDSKETKLKELSHVIGADTGRARMGFGRHVEFLGVMFRPGRAAAFLGVPVDELTGRFTALTDLWGSRGRLLEEEVRDLRATRARIERIECELLRRLGRSEEPDERFASLADWIARHRGVVRVEKLSEASGLSRQYLTRKFRRLVGVTPKQFCRLARFDALLQATYQNPQVNWAAVALDCGYYDQAHLIAEFKEFTGLTPSQFFRPPSVVSAQAAD